MKAAMMSSIGLMRLPVKNSRSFTLIEILLVVVILGAVAGLAIPSFERLYANLTLKQTAENISLLMRYAQGRAVIKQRLHRLELNPENATYQLTWQNSQDETSNPSQDFENIPSRLGRLFSIPQNLTLEIDEGKRFIMFYPDRTIDQVHLYLFDGRKRYFTISTQEQTGHIEVFDGKME